MSNWINKLIKKYTLSTAKKAKETKETAVGPWVDVVKVHFDPNNPTQGYFELDWNDDFVGLLGEAGYAGATPEAIVDLWFNDLCRSVAVDAESENREA
tara:strand:+ start:356 stop:649 length:294 start_codon:yes stop_codon:yes gene_type:complete